MGHEKIEENIYYDSRCTKAPYFINIMRRGHTLYKKFKTLDEALEAKEDFVERFSSHATEHPFVFRRGNKFVIEILVEKSFDGYEVALKKANLLQRFIEND